MARKEPASDPTPGINVTPVHIGGDSIVDRLLPHLSKIAVGAVALAVVLTGFFTWRWYRHSQEAKSTARLVKALELRDRDVVAEPPADATDPSWKTHGERDSATLAALGKVGAARGAASLYAANLLANAGKLDEALAAYRKLGAGSGDDAVLAREGVGLVLEMKAAAADPATKAKLVEEALAAFRAVQPDDKGLHRDHALYHEGRLLMETQRNAEAVAPLTRALELVPESMLRGDISDRLALLGAPVPEPTGLPAGLTP